MTCSAAAKHNPLISVTTIGVIAAFLAATAEALYAPLVKLTGADAGIMMSVAFLFFGAGCGSLIILFFGRKSKSLFDPERHLRKKDTGKLIGVIVLGLAAVSLDVTGFNMVSAGTASLLQNLITVTTILLAAFLLKEKISKRLGIGVTLIILGSIALSITKIATFEFSIGALVLIGSAIVSGFLYIMMKLLSDRNPVEITIVLGVCAGIIAFLIALCLGESLPSLQSALGLMAAGFVICGLSPVFLMYGQRYLGAAKAGAIFGIYPLLGVLLAIPLLGEMPTASLLAALILFIPGMYFVIVKQNRKAVAEAESGDEFDGMDAEYIKSISEQRKTGMKNQLTSLGFLIIAMFFVMMSLDLFGTDTAADAAADVLSSGLFIPGLIFGVFLLIIGTILLILGKRVLTGVTFIMMVPQMISFVLFGNNAVLSVLAGIFSVIFALILLTSHNRQKYAFAAVNFLLGAAFISNLLSSAVCSVVMAAAAVFLIWLSIACGTGKLQHSFSKHLTEDGDMTFGRCGAVIGYLLLAKVMTTILVYEYIDTSFFSFTDSILSLGVLYSGMLAFVGVMLMFIGKRRAPAVFFIGSAIALSLDLFSYGVFLYLPIIFLLVFGILNILRKNSPILTSSFLIGYAFLTMLYLQLEVFPEVQTAMLLLTLICAAIALYLSFAVFSEKPKLPVF